MVVVIGRDIEGRHESAYGMLIFMYDHRWFLILISMNSRRQVL